MIHLFHFSNPFSFVHTNLINMTHNFPPQLQWHTFHCSISFHPFFFLHKVTKISRNFITFLITIANSSIHKISLHTCNIISASSDFGPSTSLPPSPQSLWYSKFFFSKNVPFYLSKFFSLGDSTLSSLRTFLISFTF